MLHPTSAASRVLTANVCGLFSTYLFLCFLRRGFTSAFQVLFLSLAPFLLSIRLIVQVTSRSLHTATPPQCLALAGVEYSCIDCRAPSFLSVGSHRLAASTPLSSSFSLLVFLTRSFICDFLPKIHCDVKKYIEVFFF